jgi:HlyD family secretion protein
VDLSQLKIERDGSDGPTRRRSKRRAPLVWLVLLLFAAGAVVVFRKPLLRAVDDLRLTQVTTVKAVRANPLAASALTGTSANGYIVAAKRAALSADTPGRIVELNVIEGSVVKKGQVVARLYSDEVRAAVQRTEADLLSAQASIDRAIAQREASAADVGRLQSEIARAETAVAEPRLLRDWYTVELARWRKLADQNINDRRTVDETASNLARAEASVASAEAQVTQARAALAQGEAQVRALEAAVAEARTRVAIVEAERAQALASLDKLEVRAPFDGVVVLKDAEVGEVVSPNSQGGNSRGSVATMVDWTSLEVQVELQETSLTAAKVDEAASIFLDAYPEHRYRGRVARIWPTANRTKATVEVRVAFLDPDGKLRPEMGARVVFGSEAPEAPAGAAAEEPAVLVPRSALVPLDGGHGAFVVERDVVRLVKLELGEERGGRVLVKSGLAGGETLVSDPPSYLQAGERVRIKEQ